MHPKINDFEGEAKATRLRNAMQIPEHYERVQHSERCAGIEPRERSNLRQRELGAVCGKRFEYAKAFREGIYQIARIFRRVRLIACRLRRSTRSGFRCHPVFLAPRVRVFRNAKFLWELETKRMTSSMSSLRV